MNRISHDLAGAMQRIARLNEDLTAGVDETRQAWRDERGRMYFQQYISEVDPTLKQLISTLANAVEQFEGIAKKLQDPDRP